MPARVRHEFLSLSAIMEAVTGISYTQRGATVGVTTPPLLFHQLGPGAWRLHPYGLYFAFGPEAVPVGMEVEAPEDGPGDPGDGIPTANY